LARDVPRIQRSAITRFPPFFASLTPVIQITAIEGIKVAKLRKFVYVGVRSLPFLASLLPRHFAYERRLPTRARLREPTSQEEEHHEEGQEEIRRRTNAAGDSVTGFPHPRIFRKSSMG
jgi:hypothetical protein